MKDLGELKEFVDRASATYQDLEDSKKKLESVQKYPWSRVSVGIDFTAASGSVWIKKEIVIQMLESSIQHLTEELRKSEEVIKKFEAPQ